ncbi:hypothetical protein EDD18DRAFT_1080707, partial [Armillaria luteobubalina]
PNGSLRACSTHLQNSEHVVVLSSDQYAGGSNCGRRIRVNCRSSHRKLCSCHCDLASSAFEKLTSLDDGRILVTWQYE